MAFQFPGFQEPGFQGGEELPVGGAQATRQERIPRWLVSFERVGKMTFLSDVGGDVLGTYYVPAIVDISHSEVLIDLERMSIPKGTCTVSVSPSSLKEHFIALDEIGQAKVTVASWDGYTIRPVIVADMKELGEGFDGELISFRLTEEWRYNPIFPERLVNFDGFPASAIADGARFRTFTQAWGDAQQVPAFPVLDIGGGTQRWMIVGHNVPNLPTGGSGTPVRFKDALNATYIGADLGDPVSPYYNFADSYSLDKAGDLLRNLIEKHSTYPDTLVDHAQLNLVYMYLNRFPIGGYIDQEGPIFDFIESRFQRQFLFVIYEQGGMLRGTAIDPTAPGVHTLVYNKHLLQLQEPVTEDKRYTHFKVRYRWRPKPPNPGWYGVSDIGAFNDEYLKQAQLLWGQNMFGDPVEFKRHAPSVDLADVNLDATAITIRTHYAKLFHRGTRLKYLQLASAADIPLGTVVNLLDPERNQNMKRSILIGRKWETPELVTHTYRTIEPFGILGVAAQGVSEPPPPPEIQCQFIDVFGEVLECVAPLNNSPGVTFDASTGIWTIDGQVSSGLGVGTQNCPLSVPSGYVVDMGVWVMSYGEGGSGLNTFILRLHNAAGGAGIEQAIAFMHGPCVGSTGGGPCHSSHVYMNGINPLGATSVYITVTDYNGQKIAVSDLYLKVRHSSDTPEHNGSGGCYFANHPGLYCPDCENLVCP